MSPRRPRPLRVPPDLFADGRHLCIARRSCPQHLRLFADQADRVLGRSARAGRARGELDADAAADFGNLLVDACARVMCHPIVASNRYLERFAQGVTFAQARHELQQFSVFAAQFDVAQAKLVANAPTLEAYLERLKVLLNEKGIPYEHGFEGELTGRWSWTRSTSPGCGTWRRAWAWSSKTWPRSGSACPARMAFVDATFKLLRQHRSEHGAGGLVRHRELGRQQSVEAVDRRHEEAERRRCRSR